MNISKHRHRGHPARAVRLNHPSYAKFVAADAGDDSITSLAVPGMGGSGILRVVNLSDLDNIIFAIGKNYSEVGLLRTLFLFVTIISFRTTNGSL